MTYNDAGLGSVRFLAVENALDAQIRASRAFNFQNLKPRQGMGMKGVE